jgi:predicted chitinase
MADNLNASNKKISALAFFGGDIVERYRQELIAEGKIPGTNLSATSEQRKKGFNLYRKNKIEFKTFVEKVLMKKDISASKMGGNIKKIGGFGAIVKASSTNNDFDEIIKILNSIISTLQNQFKFDKKKSDKDKKDEESGRRSKRENALEAVKKVSSKLIEKVVAPFKSIFDRIWNFIFYTLLGRAFTKLMDWLSDPKNAQKVAVLGKFLKDWWPALIGLYFSPFKKFMATTIARIAWFAARFALFNPVGLALTAATVGAVAKIKESERMRPLVQKNQKEIDKKLNNKDAPWYEKLGAYFANQSLNAPGGPKNPMGLPSPGGGYSGGGYINSNTGTRISGAGPDTQLTALMPGEVVMNRATVKAIGADKLLALNAKYGGSNANKPKFTNNIQFAAGGGMVGARKFAGNSKLGIGELPLIRAANSAGIKGLELAAFLSQMAHETGGFNWNTEFGGGRDDYSGGKKFKGRGYVQLTHDYNYKTYGNKLGIDLIKNPDLAASGDIAAKIAVMYWKDKVRPAVGNKWNDTFLVSRAINYPGAKTPEDINGYSDRVARFREYSNKLNTGGLNIPQPKSKSKSPPKNGFLQNAFQQSGNFVNSLFGIGPSDANTNRVKESKGSSRYIPSPLSKAGNGGMITLPPISQSSGGGMKAGAAGTPEIAFSAVSPSGAADRSMNANIYGIVG